jgi:hypothetical protein
VAVSETVRVLEEARRLLLEKGWTQGTFARDRKGDAIEFDSPRAACFCTSGAIMRVGESPDRSAEFYAFRALRKFLGDQTIAEWNDDPRRTREDVLGLFDRAIAAESAR